MTRKFWLMLSLAAVAVAAAGFVACGDDDDVSEEDKQELADIVARIAGINGEDATQEDIDFFMEHITETMIQDLGTESLEACQADPVNCIGEALPNQAVDPEDVEIDGDTGSAIIQSDIGPFAVYTLKEDGVWKVNGLFVADDEIADGTEVVDLDLVEFGFNGDLELDAVKSGDFALHVTNHGEQQHEVILVPLPEEGAIEDIIADESFEPEPIFVKVPYGPGDESDVALPEPLEPGRYGLFCFLPDTNDPEFTPHAFKGMTAEFTVEG